MLRQTPDPEKVAQSEEIQRLTEEFLREGGEINQLQPAPVILWESPRCISEN